MANYFQIDGAFWTDPDIIDEFTPEDKYFYLYLLTSVHANISGCYEISIKQVADEMGYSKDTITHLIDRFMKVHELIDYDPGTKEVLIHKWGKHHWTTSDKYAVALKKKIEGIKSPKFKAFLQATYERFTDPDIPRDRVWIPYREFRYGMDTTYPYTYSYPYTSTSSYKEGDSKKEGVGEGEEGADEQEPEGQEAQEDVVITLILNDKTEYPIVSSYVEKMKELYPNVDVMRELRKMSAWCINNPKRRKTKNGIKAFINNWLSSEQDKLAFIDCMMGKIHHADAGNDVHSLIVERFEYELDDQGRLSEPEDFLNIEFMEDCYELGRKKAKLYCNHLTDDHHINEKVMKIIVRVITAVMNWEG